MLALHLLAALAIASALVLFSVLVITGQRMTTLEQTRALFRVAPIGAALISSGAVLVLVLGVILSLDSDEFEIYDPWVLAAIVLWTFLGYLGSKSGRYYQSIADEAKGSEPGTEATVLARLRAPEGPLTHYAIVGVFLLIVLDMLFKAGA